MTPSLATPLDELAAHVLKLEAAHVPAHMSFDTAVYDPCTDRLVLTAGPPTAARAELTPEGHVVRVAAPDGYVCGLVLVGVQERLAREGHVRVTMGADRVATLSACDVAELLSRAVVRLNTRRFARR